MTIDGAPPKIGTFKWVREVEETEYQSVITHLITQTKEIFSYPVLYLDYQHTEKTKNNILALLNLAKTAERNRYFAAYIVYKTIFKKVVTILEFCSFHKPSQAPYSISDSITNRSARMLQTFSFIQSRYYLKGAGNSLFSGLEIQSLPTMPQISPNQGQTLTIFPKVNDLILYVQHLHGLASNSFTTTEEDYFLEEIVKSYLPDLLTNAAAVEGGSLMLRSEAESNFTEQLNLISLKLDEIIKRASQKALRQAETQTSFLNMKLNSVHSGPLELEK